LFSLFYGMFPRGLLYAFLLNFWAWNTPWVLGITMRPLFLYEVVTPATLCRLFPVIFIPLNPPSPLVLVLVLLLGGGFFFLFLMKEDRLPFGWGLGGGFLSLSKFGSTFVRRLWSIAAIFLSPPSFLEAFTLLSSRMNFLFSFIWNLTLLFPARMISCRARALENLAEAWGERVVELGRERERLERADFNFETVRSFFRER